MFTIRSGADIVTIARFERSLAKYRERFKERVFSKVELERLLTKPATILSLAARFAAKEAFMKLIGKGLWSIPLRDISILNRSTGRPYYLLSGAAECEADLLGIVSLDLSLSHDKTMAMAFAVALVKEG
ncbi:MAG: holo-ACP synthase [Nitrospinota bacterium]